VKLYIIPNRQANNCVLVISIIISVSFFCCNWNWPIGLL